MKCIMGIILCALAKSGLAQSLDTIVSVSGSVTWVQSLSVSSGIDSDELDVVSIWDENGLVAGPAGSELVVGPVGLSTGTGQLSPIGAWYPVPQVYSVTVAQSYVAVIGRAPTGNSIIPFSCEGEFTLQCAAVVSVGGFVKANIRMAGSTWHRWQNANEVLDPVLNLNGDAPVGVVVGPRNFKATGEVAAIDLVPGDYHIIYDDSGSVLLSGELAPRHGTAGAGIFQYSRAGPVGIDFIGNANIPCEYDLDLDGLYSIADLELWWQKSSSGDVVYDTLGDGIVDDDDRSELFRALTFVAPSSLIDCDQNGRHDPFELLYGGAEPDCDVCLADANGDGLVTPADFTAWINAFNNNLPECDQDNDGACTPTDFTAWIANFNAGC